MSRRLVGALLGIAAFGLSCGPLFGAPGASQSVRNDVDVTRVTRLRGPAPERALAGRAEDPQIAAVVEYLSSRDTGLVREEIDSLARTLVLEARAHRLDLALVLAVMHVESRYHNFALSPAGAVGLMQLLPSTAAELAAREGIAWHGPQTLLDPVANVRLGIAYLSELSRRYRGDLQAALAAYNWGPGEIDRRLQDGTELPSEYPGLVWRSRAQRTIARVSFAPTSAATKRSSPLIAASSEPR